MKAKPLLDYINNYITLTDKEEDFLISKIVFRKYLKGQYIVQQGDVCKHINFITKGCTRTFIVDQNGNEQSIMFAIKDWWCSDMGSFITQKPADYNVQCYEDTELIQLPYQTIDQLFENIPKLERFFRKVTERALIASQKRIVENFSLSAKQRYLIFQEKYPEIEKRIPQYMVASYLGITKEFLSKVKSQLIQDNN